MTTHVDLNKPLTGTPREQAVELYTLRRDHAAMVRALDLQGASSVSPQEAEQLVNLVTNKHRNTDGFILTVDEVAKLLNHVRQGRMTG